MIIRYIHQSGFSVRTSNHFLVFDYDGARFFGPEDFDGQPNPISFASHRHSDHFCEAMLDFPGAHVLAMDIPETLGGLRIEPGKTLQVAGAQIRAFGSTDEGVSFLIDCDGKRIFHAGDLNDWHWKHESTCEEAEQARRDYEIILDEIATEAGRRAIDVSFFPVDPRMGKGCEEGALRFLERVPCGTLIPMHFWDKPKSAEDFAARYSDRGNILVLNRPGQSIELPENGEQTRDA